jgi:predicted SprT family Zn-dependent metalloprotease
MTEKQLQELTNQITDTWKMNPVLAKIMPEELMPDLTGAVALWTEDGDIIVLNSLITNSNVGFDYILNVVYHELAHLYTRKSDNDVEFQLFCKLNNIWLNQNEDNIWNGEPHEIQAKYEDYE